MASKPTAPASPALILFDDLVRCETRLYNALNDLLRERHGLVTSQFEFLRYIRDHPGARVADLAASFAIGIGATSKGTDRHEQRGWIRREPNPDDRRSSLLTLTAAGSEVLTAAERTFTECVEQLIGSAVEPARLADAAATMSGLRHALERDRVGVPTG